LWRPHIFRAFRVIETYRGKTIAISPVALVLVVILAGQWAALSQQDPGESSNQAEKTRDSTKSDSPGFEPLPAGRAPLSPEQIRGLVQKVADKEIENHKKEHNYTYVEREEQHHLDGKGTVKSTESKTSDVMMIYGEQVERLIAKNDKPLSDKEAAKEDEKIQRLIDKRKREGAEERRKRLEGEEKQRQEERDFVRDVSDAYRFRLAGSERLEGRETYVIDAEPRTDFEPRHKNAKLLTKFRFRVWIDKAESQWVKLDAQCIDTVAWGLVVARIHQGSRILIETTRVNDEVWLPKHVEVKLDARVALLKNFREDIDISYRDYKKFRSDTRIVGVGDTEGK